MAMTASADRTTTAGRTRQESTPRRWSPRWAGYAAAVWSLAYMLPHLYWAAGGTAMRSAFRPAAAEEPAFRLINGVASAMLTGAALVVFLLARGVRPRPLRWGLLAIAWAGGALSVAHAIYGIVDRTLIVSGARLVESRSFAVDEHGWVLWDLLLFEPWFLIEGLLFGLAGWASLARPRDRRRWVSVCVVGVLGGLGTAILGVRVA
jgi:hypothetical protein